MRYVFDALQYIQNNYKYKSDKIGEDYPQTVKETMELKTGDCEDFAFLLGSILERTGKYEWAIYDCGEHLSVAIYWNKKWQVIDPKGSKTIGDMPLPMKKMKCVVIKKEA